MNNGAKQPCVIVLVAILTFSVPALSQDSPKAEEDEKKMELEKLWKARASEIVTTQLKVKRYSYTMLANDESNVVTSSLIIGLLGDESRNLDAVMRDIFDRLPELRQGCSKAEGWERVD